MRGVKNMRFNEVYSTLQNLIKAEINQAELGRVLGVSRANINYKKQANVLLSDEDVKKIETYYNVVLLEGGVKNLALMPLNGIIDIPYWEGLPEDLKAKDFPVTAPRKVIKNHWYLNPDALRIVPMVGDKMTNYWYRINENDILIIDTSHNFIRGNGVYFATSRNNTRFWIREMQALINDDIQIKGFAPSGETTKVFKPEQLKEVDFKIIGKVIKNVSFRL